MRRTVAALIETSSGHGRAILRGIAAYAEQGARWGFHFELWSQINPALLAQYAHADGIITRVVDDAYARALRLCKKPTVIVASARGLPGMPAVVSDGVTIGEMAADHLAGLGFRRLAYCGSDNVAFSDVRGDACERRASELGLPCSRLALRGGHDLELASRHLSHWLKSLPKPVGLFAATDGVARQVLLACQAADIDVPQEVAIVGVNDDEMICRLSNPQLSSIDHGAQQIGFRAAQILDRLMAGCRPPRLPVVVPPVRVVVRGSSDVLAIEDAPVAAAVRYIRVNAHRPIKVADVARESAIGRRSLELAFRRALGRGVHEEILRSRLAIAQRLLLETVWPMPEVARACGLTYASHLSALFRTRLGMTPTAYRRLHARQPGTPTPPDRSEPPKTATPHRSP